MGIDDIVLWLGSLEALNKSQERVFALVPGERVEMTCHGNYEPARKRFKIFLVRRGYAGVTYYGVNQKGVSKWYLKGYPIIEKKVNKQEGVSQ